MKYIMIIFRVLSLLLRFLNFKICCALFSHSKLIFIFVLTLYLAFCLLFTKDGAKNDSSYRPPKAWVCPCVPVEQMGGSYWDGKIKGQRVRALLQVTFITKVRSQSHLTSQLDSLTANYHDGPYLEEEKYWYNRGPPCTQLGFSCWHKLSASGLGLEDGYSSEKPRSLLERTHSKGSRSLAWALSSKIIECHFCFMDNTFTLNHSLLTRLTVSPLQRRSEPQESSFPKALV